MNKLFRIAKDVVSFSTKRKRLDLIDNQQTVVDYIHLCFLLDSCQLQQRAHGGDKQKEIPRKRKNFREDIVIPLGDVYFRRSYRMKIQSFYILYSILKSELENEFLPQVQNNRRKQSKYHIDLKIRLSAALRFFAGGDPYDIMISHGISHSSVYRSIWGVVDCVNRCETLSFHFPTHEEQRTIAQGFKSMSGALFDCVIGCIDGMLVWTTKPSKSECKKEKCGEKNFKCSRKDKFGLNLQAICDNKLKFIWIDIKWPGATSDYMAWVTTALCHELESTDKLANGMCLVGDNAYIKKRYMSVPLKGIVNTYDDAYNFYCSQLRITIERAFGVLVHRWSILRRPINCPLHKVSPMIMALCRLHNFCIDMKERDAPMTTKEDASHSIASLDAMNRSPDDAGGSTDIVRIEHGRPTSLLNGGCHFLDAPRNRLQATDHCPMDTMLEQVKSMNLTRPKNTK